ncbi:MAG: c-type cytochrome [Planctomycetaceae bacterium]
MLKLLVLLALLPQETGNLLDVVNSERGGRHWIDQKPDPPKSPEDTLKSFQIEPGSRIELVAAEPLVFDPVWIDFDRAGRMYVAEYTDYPIGPVKADGSEDKDATSLSKIVLLEDRDGDGRMDKRTVFADGLTFCHSFMPLMDGILACAQTEILFLKDTDGDNVADVREVWFDGFEPAHPQMQIGCPRWGLDNWIYLTYAPGEIRCRRPGFETQEAVKLPRQDMRFNPRTMAFEAISGLGQFGQAIDNDGHRFFCTNRNPIMMEIIPDEASRRNPFVTISKRHTDVGPSGGDTRVFPLVDMKSNWLAHAGTHTSACGVSAYQGDLWDRDFQHSVFACEPVGHLVTRSIVKPQNNSPALTVERARKDADFLASNDTWFRPASLKTGPDGGWYLADMYRMWVEHPKFLPPDIAAQIDWRAGEDRGRIWRIVPDSPANANVSNTSFTAPDTTADFVALLSDDNGWCRFMAQQNLVESSDPQVAQQLRALLANPDAPVTAKVHAVWCLHGRGEFQNPDMADAVRGVADADLAALLRTQLQICSGSMLAAARKQAAIRPEADLRFQAVLACRHADEKTSALELQNVLLPVIRRDAAHEWFADALLLSAGRHGLSLLNEVASTQNDDHANTASLANRLAELLGRTESADNIAAALKTAVDCTESSRWLTVSILKGLATGLPRNSQGVPKSLAAFLAAPPDAAREVCTAVAGILDGMASEALDRRLPLADRKAAVDILTLKSPADAAVIIQKLLVPDEAGELQRAAIETARRSGNAVVAESLLSLWNNLSPAVRSDALGLLMARTNTTTELLTSMLSGTVSPSFVDIDQRVRLLQHSDENIRKLAGEVFGGVVSANRKAVADEYQSALTMKASSERGAAVFEKTCSKCHKINGKGHNVGPDISDTQRRSRDALLYDILDPNRRVDPQFSEYVVVTNDGLTFNGLLVSDSGEQIVLRQPEGKEQTVLRADIDVMQATNRSLMPEGVEKDVSIQQMADLLEFLKVR